MTLVCSFADLAAMAESGEISQVKFGELLAHDAEFAAWWEERCAMESRHE